MFVEFARSTIRTFRLELSVAEDHVLPHRSEVVPSVYVVSDVLSDVDWTPDFGSIEIQRGLTVLVDAAIEVIEAG